MTTTIIEGKKSSPALRSAAAASRTASAPCYYATYSIKKGIGILFYAR